MFTISELFEIVDTMTVPKEEMKASFENEKVTTVDSLKQLIVEREAVFAKIVGNTGNERIIKDAIKVTEKGEVYVFLKKIRLSSLEEIYDLLLKNELSVLEI